MKQTATATFCTTVIDQWVTMGLTDAFVAPGSRSTPVALALLADTRVSVHLFHDERSASFACLGHGLATGRPAVLLCTSGTAATHFHGAVVEADASRVPMLVCTADRPPELWGVGAPQTIDQTDLYGEAVRGFLEPGPPDDPGVDPTTWRPMAADAWHAAAGSGAGLAGPIHLNLSFRDPLVGVPGPLPPPLPSTQITARMTPPLPPSVADLFVDDLPERGAIVVGRSNADPADVFALSKVTGWPVIADARSRCQRSDSAITRFDSLLRSSEFGDDLRPDLVIRIGEPPASKVLGQWIERSAAAGATVLALTDGGQIIDPERVASAILDVEETLPSLVVAAMQHARSSNEFGARWLEANRVAEAVIGDRLAAAPLSEPAIARAVTAGLAGGHALVVSSSMPIRDVEWYGTPRDDIDVFANRGANGIDGVVSTAIGVALSGQPTTLLIGDVAFLHDSNALIGLRKRPIDLTIVVVDNDGGGIFSFLPQHEQMAADDYEFLFGTPHGTDLTTLCVAHGIVASEWSEHELNQPGVRVLVATTDRQTNLELHNRLVEAVTTRSAQLEG